MKKDGRANLQRVTAAATLLAVAFGGMKWYRKGTQSGLMFDKFQ